MSSIPPHFTGSSPPLSCRRTSSSELHLEDSVAADECCPEIEGGTASLLSLCASPPQPFNAPATMLHSNIKEAFRLVQSTTKEATGFRDWFHGFANILCLLGSRASGNPEDFLLSLSRYRKLLKAELIRGQIQATYTREDSDRLGRPRSPLVREGYGRAVRTGLWMAASAVRADQIRGLLKDKDKIKLLENFEIFPVSRAFEYAGRRPHILCNLDAADLRLTEMAYIEPLRVQLIHKSKVHFNDLQTQFGRRGLRASPSECADICAESMMRKIVVGDVQGALKLLDKAFEGRAAEAVRAGLSTIELRPNTLIVPSGTDPLTDSTLEQQSQLKEAYERCFNHSMERLPFYLEQNIQVVRNLIGDITEFSQPGMPAMICSDLTEALLNVADLVSAARCQSNPAANPQGWSRDMERLYQSMQSIHHVVRFQNDWAGRAPNLEAVIASLVLGACRTWSAESENGIQRGQFLQDSQAHSPAMGQEDCEKWTAAAHLQPAISKSDRLLGRAEEPAWGFTSEEADALGSYLRVERAPHAMALLEQVRASLPERISIACLANGYYETPTLFQDPLQCDVVTHPDLPGQDLIIMEPHPNNGAKLSVHAHDPVVLINHLFSRRPDLARTLVIDATLNHLTERQITLALLAAKPHIESGKLNLVLLQSATKFMQNGMDLANMGVALNFSSNRHWPEYRAFMARQRMYVPKDDEGYIASLLSEENKTSSIAYLERIRGNTGRLRALLNATIPLGHREQNAYEVCVNTDEQTVYIGLKPTDAYLAKKIGKAPDEEISAEERSTENIDLYHQCFRPAFLDLAVIDRSSFGFNVTNFGECGETIRITLGIEEPELLHEYSRRIIALGASLYAEAFGVSDPNAVPV